MRRNSRSEEYISCHRISGRHRQSYSKTRLTMLFCEPTKGACCLTKPTIVKGSKVLSRAHRSLHCSHAVYVFLLKTNSSLNQVEKKTISQQLTDNAISGDKSSMIQPKYSEIKGCLYNFVQDSRAAQLPVLRSSLRIQALKIHLKFKCATSSQHREHLNAFGASSRGVLSFRKCNFIWSIRMHAEACSESIANVAASMIQLSERIHGYEAENVFNMDETDCFKAVPDTVICLF